MQITKTYRPRGGSLGSAQRSGRRDRSVQPARLLADLPDPGDDAWRFGSVRAPRWTEPVLSRIPFFTLREAQDAVVRKPWRGSRSQGRRGHGPAGCLLPSEERIDPPDGDIGHRRLPRLLDEAH